jgi:IS30 family transposase
LLKKCPGKGAATGKTAPVPTGKGKLKVKEGQELADRPQGINERKEPGDVEINLMFSGETVWLTCVDRYTRKLRLRSFPSKESGPIAKEVYLRPESGKFRTFTTDRGLEWSALNPWVANLLKKKLNL